MDISMHGRTLQPRFIGERVRYFQCANGWMFGTVQSVRTIDGMQFATVFFPAYESRYQPYHSETTEIVGFMLERCSDSPPEPDGY